jgi:hypothetical protein
VTRDEIVLEIASRLGIDPEDEDAMEEAGVILFDGMEPAFVGLAERFEMDGHRHFAVYSYKRMVEILVADGDMDDTDAMEYLEFNTVGLYAGPGTPAILRDEE